MHSNTKAQHLPKSTALLYNLSYQLVLQPTAPGHILQIFLRVTIQNQICIAQWVIVDEIIQLRPLCHSHIQRILDSGAIDGNFSSIPEQQLHAPGVHVEFASSFIVLHVRILLKSCRSLYRPIYDFGFHLPRTPILSFPKKTNNPNPSPIGNKFGLFLFGPSGENRTHGLLNPIQARYQNCATPGHHPLPPYRSTGDMKYYTRIRQPCQQIFAIFLDFFEESMILTVMRCFASY